MCRYLVVKLPISMHEFIVLNNSEKLILDKINKKWNKNIYCAFLAIYQPNHKSNNSDINRRYNYYKYKQ